MRKYLLILLGSIGLLICWASPDFRYRLWFDDKDSDAIEGVLATDALTLYADVSALAPSVHTLHVQIFGPDGEPSVTRSAIFFNVSVEEVGAVRYWFDRKTESAVTLPFGTTTANIDVRGLTDGIHTLHIQSVGKDPSPVRSAIFAKLPVFAGESEFKCIISIDGKLFAEKSVTANNGTMLIDLPLTGVSEGLHTLSLQLVAPSGSVSSTRTCYFLKSPTENEISSMRCYYAVDGKPGTMEAGTFDNGDFHFDVDIASYADGLHNISYMLVLPNGGVTDIRNAYFWKVPLGGDGIVSYHYWLNDDYAHAREVKLAGLVKTLDLTELLPVESVLLRSSSFHFEFDNAGEPWIYARNDFHIRFYGADSRFGEETKAFTDYAVKQKVENVTTFTGIGSVTKPKPAENQIHWYKISAQIGDSISLQANKPCTMQAFSPTGATLVQVKDYDATKMCGFRAYDNGDYYIAIHDATYNSGEVTLNYEHIDKYAVLSVTPNTIGAASGYVHMSLLGNGFDKLTNVRLKHGSVELWSNEIEATDVSHATVEFFIPNDDIALGKYDLVLDFTENNETETLEKAEAVTMAEAVYGDIHVDVTSRRSVAKPYPVTVTVTNTGSVEYQMIPIFVGWEDVDGIEEFCLLNASIMLTDTEGPEQDRVILTDDLLGKGIKGIAIPLMIPYLGAGESVDLQVGYIAQPHTKFDFYAWAYQPWSLSGTDEFAGGAQRKPYATSRYRAPDRDNPLCSMDPCGELGSYVPQVQSCLCQMSWGNISMLSGAYLGQYNRWANQMNSWIASQGMDDYIDGARYPRVRLCDPNDILRRIGRDCSPGGDALERIRGALDGMARDRCPDPPAHHTDVYMPGDPNDMLGYVSPAGTQYIKRDLKDVSYTIEFENDPEIANAAAHHITISNRIDGTKLDLSTFRIKSMKLAHRNVDLSMFGNNFVTTIDMRPQINSLAQLTQTFDENSGLVTWDILALDPMSMNPTDDVMQGILPVNGSDNNGIGEIIYDITLAAGLADGTSIKNSASITFDQEDAIDTPVWENIIDSQLPSSHVVKATSTGPSALLLDIAGEDQRSDIWKYDIYMRPASGGEWTLLKAGVEGSQATIETDTRGIKGYAFCSIAYDMADNMEEKALTEEAILSQVIKGDVNNDGMFSVVDVSMTVAYVLGQTPLGSIIEAADVNEDGSISAVDVSLVVSYILSGRTTSPLRPLKGELQPGGMSEFSEYSEFSESSDISENAEGTLELSISGMAAYSAAQFDIALPEGVAVKSVNLLGSDGTGHSVAFSQADGTARVLAFSPLNRNFGADATFEIELDGSARGDDGIAVDGIRLVQIAGNGITETAATGCAADFDISGLLASLNGGIDIMATADGVVIIASEECDITIADALGRTLRRHLHPGTTRIALSNGVYLINNEKVIIK